MNSIRFFRLLAGLSMALWSAGVALAQTATLTTPATSYSSTGGAVTLTATINFPGQTLSTLGWTLNLPAGWSYASSSTGVGAPDVSPRIGDTGDISPLGWAYIDPTGFVGSAQFTTTLNYVAGLSGNQVFGANVKYKVVGNSTLQTIALSNIALARAPLSATQAVASKTLTAGTAAIAFFPVIPASGTAPYVFSISPPLPVGLTLDTSSGSISGTPTAPAATANYTVTIADSASATANNTFSLTVNPALTSTQAIPTKSLTIGTAAAAFIPVTIAGGTAPFGYAISPALPVGLTLDASSGSISGTPTVLSATATYTVTITDGVGAVTSKTFALTVNAVSVVPVVTSLTTATGVVGTAFSYTITASNSPTSFAATNLPANLTLNAATGVISGTPAAAGTSQISLTATNAGGTSAAVTLTLTVTAQVAPTITTQPADQFVDAGQTATFTVVATGTPAPLYQWKRNGSDLSGATSATLTIPNVQAANEGSYTVVVSNGVGSAITSNAATLGIRTAPAITTQPVSQAVAEGGSVTFSVVATGKPAPGYQWKKGTALINGATNASYTIASVVPGDAGSYSVVVSNGVNPNATSNPATLTVFPAGWGATHAVVGAGYIAGGTVTITNTISFTGDISGLGWSVLLPAGWTYANSSGNFDVPPSGTIGVLNWAWTSTPASPVTFTYTLNVPASETASQSLAAIATVADVNGNQIKMLAKPDPLVVGPVLYHTADTSHNFSIDLNELIRVISIYNARFTAPDGKVQTGCYKVQSGTVDGFAPDPSRAAPAAPGQAGLAAYHSADTNRDGAIDLNELIRVISLYNTRFTTADGKIQTGFYKVQAGTIDGYAPDPTRAP